LADIISNVLPYNRVADIISSLLMSNDFSKQPNDNYGESIDCAFSDFLLQMHTIVFSDWYVNDSEFYWGLFALFDCKMQ